MLYKSNHFDKHITDEFIEFRRDLHRHPELGFLEMRTASKVVEMLESFNIPYVYGRDIMSEESLMGFPTHEELESHFELMKDESDKIELFKDGFTAILATIETTRPGPKTLLRFDMDALPIFENNTEEHIPVKEGYRSKFDGVMHACGHDVHTTTGLMVAKYISEHLDEFKGTIEILFQPAEEGVRGAKSIVDKGVLNNIDYFIASHVGLRRKSGELLISEEGFLASTKIDLTVKGVSSHAGSHPDEGKNALLAACQLVNQFYSISRTHLGSTRLNVGTLTAGSGRNIIADNAFLQLETRGATTEANQYVYDQLMNIIKGIEYSYSVTIEIEKVGEAETVTASEELKRFLFNVATEVYGEANVVYESHAPSGSEDATFIMNHVNRMGGQAIYMNYGTNLTGPHHNERFDVVESDMIQYANFLIEALKQLQNK